MGSQALGFALLKRVGVCAPLFWTSSIGAELSCGSAFGGSVRLTCDPAEFPGGCATGRVDREGGTTLPTFDRLGARELVVFQATRAVNANVFVGTSVTVGSPSLTEASRPAVRHSSNKPWLRAVSAWRKRPLLRSAAAR